MNIPLGPQMTMVNFFLFGTFPSGHPDDQPPYELGLCDVDALAGAPPPFRQKPSVRRAFGESLTESGCGLYPQVTL